MRRTLAGLIFGIAYVCASLAISGWLLHRSAFDPDRTGNLANVVLQDDRIKTEITNTIADAAAEQRGLDKALTRKTVHDVATNPQGAALFGKILHDAHARMIGLHNGPVRITGSQMVQVVRDEKVGDIPSITLPVPRISSLDLIRRILRWTIPFGALFAVGFLVIGFMLHPNRSAMVRSLGYGMVLLALLIAVLGYIVPRFLLPTLSDSMWADVPARLANDSLPLLIGLAILLGGGGTMLLVGSRLTGRRRRWNAPVSTYRYREERRWG